MADISTEIKSVVDVSIVRRAAPQSARKYALAVGYLQQNKTDPGDAAEDARKAE